MPHTTHPLGHLARVERAMQGVRREEAVAALGVGGEKVELDVGEERTELDVGEERAELDVGEVRAAAELDVGEERAELDVGEEMRGVDEPVDVATRGERDVGEQDGVGEKGAELEVGEQREVAVDQEGGPGPKRVKVTQQKTVKKAKKRPTGSWRGRWMFPV